MTTIVAPGRTFTPKQLQIDKPNGKLYWSDREGMRVMRANLDGSDIETLVDTSQGDSRPGADPNKWCVGIAVDADAGKLYWSQKGGDNAGEGRILRANLDIPRGQTPTDRADIELLYDKLPEPIDLDLDLRSRMLYWTDRGDPPRGNTVNRAPLDAPPGQAPAARDRLLQLDGRDRPGLGSEARPHVHHRFRRLGLQRQPRRVGPENLALCGGQPDRDCLCRVARGLNRDQTGVSQQPNTP